MRLPLNPLILVLGIIMSFVLFEQGEKYNLETSDYGRISRECEASNLDYNECFHRRGEKIRELYGATYHELEADKTRRMVYLIIPCLVLITTIFVSFAVEENEKYLSLLALSPLFLSFLRFYPYAPEKWMIPFYLLLAAGTACSIRCLKGFLYFRSS